MKMNLSNLSNTFNTAYNTLFESTTDIKDPPIITPPDVISNFFPDTSYEGLVYGVPKLSEDDRNIVEDYIKELNGTPSPTETSTVLYHSSPKKFDKFEITQGKRSGFMGAQRVVQNQGIFMSPNKRLAYYFGDNRGPGSTMYTYTAYVECGNILDLTPANIRPVLGRDLFKKALKAAREHTDNANLNAISRTNRWAICDDADFMDAVREAGYNSVKFREEPVIERESNVSPAITYLILDTAQISIIPTERPIPDLDYLYRYLIDNRLVDTSLTFELMTEEQVHDYKMENWEWYRKMEAKKASKDPLLGQGIS